MDQFIDYSAYDQAEDSGEALGHPTQQQQQHFPHAVNAQLTDQTRSTLYHTVVPPMSCDVKPRLTKEQHDILENHFQAHHKPSTSVKRAFAERLHVSLDKVNNWFQNRRAKAKQDAKKNAQQASMYGAHAQAFGSGSDSEPSPFQPSQQFAMMQQQMQSDEDLTNGLGISQMPQPQPQVNGLPYNNDLAAQAQFQNYSFGQGLSTDMYHAQLAEMNRRTLTQENFDAMSRDGGMMNGDGQFESFNMVGFSENDDLVNQMFPVHDTKQEGVPMGYPIVAPPLSSNDSTVPSIGSDHSLQMFPSSNVMQHQASMSAPGSDWADSRSSSLASSHHSAMGAQMIPVQSHPQPATSQWEPGSSVPINVNTMKNEFQQAAAQGSVRASMDQSQGHDQPLAYLEDDAYVRRGSTASMLAHSMGGIGLTTPQLNQSNEQFKAPMPPANIAARRQRPKPANLVNAALRSQSFGGPGQPSPVYQYGLPHGQSIRRAVSSNVLNGVANGRVMKSVPGSAQRSPINISFSDAMNSPHLVRAVSHGNLAPPTPLSPSHPSQAQQAQAPNWPQAAAPAVRQPSINENEEPGAAMAAAAGVHYQPSASVPPHVSPPHTPHWLQQPFAPYRIGSNVIMENTPPQSAPASQTSFGNVFAAPPAPNPHMTAIANAQQQQYLNLAVPEQQFQMSNVTFAPGQHANVVASGPPPGVPLTFATGVPVMAADGNIQMTFPTQMQMMQPSQSPPQVPYAFVNSNGTSPGSMSAGQPPKLATQPANDFVVHEYSPPDSMKRSVTPQKPVNSGPKNYNFHHQGPVDFEDKKLKKESSSSPASSNGTLSTI